MYRSCRAQLLLLDGVLKVLVGVATLLLGLWGKIGCVNEYMCVWALCERERDRQTERKRERERERNSYREWHIENLEFAAVQSVSQSVSQRAFVQFRLCRWASRPWNEQCTVRFWCSSSSWCTQEDGPAWSLVIPLIQVKENLVVAYIVF